MNYFYEPTPIDLSKLQKWERYTSSKYGRSGRNQRSYHPKMQRITMQINEFTNNWIFNRIGEEIKEIQQYYFCDKFVHIVKMCIYRFSPQWNRIST